MVQAIWNGAVIAETNSTTLIEGNHYFPPDSVNWDLLQPNEHRTICPWKGTAAYYDVVVQGVENRKAAWTYAVPSDQAAVIRDHVAFWHGVVVVE